MSNIEISKKFGLNPSIRKCFICGDSMDIVLFGAAYKENGKTAQAPMEFTNEQCICDRCRNVIEKQNGIFFISVRDGETGNNPYRTGKITALKEDAVKRIFKNYKKINYMEDSTFDKLFSNSNTTQNE